MKKFLLMIALIFAVTTYTFAQDPARDFLERSNPNYLDQLDRVLNDIEHKVYNKKISKSALDKVISALQAQQKKITKPSNCDLNCVLALNEKKLTYTFIINSLLNIQKKYFNVSTTTPRPTTPGTTNPNSSNGDADSTVPVDVLSIQNLFSGYVYLGETSFDYSGFQFYQLSFDIYKSKGLNIPELIMVDENGAVVGKKTNLQAGNTVEVGQNLNINNVEAVGRFFLFAKIAPTLKGDYYYYFLTQSLAFKKNGILRSYPTYEIYGNSTYKTTTGTNKTNMTFTVSSKPASYSSKMIQEVGTYILSNQEADLLITSIEFAFDGSSPLTLSSLEMTILGSATPYKGNGMVIVPKNLILNKNQQLRFSLQGLFPELTSAQNNAILRIKSLRYLDLQTGQLKNITF